jgi:hypothetical protein
MTEGWWVISPGGTKFVAYIYDPYFYTFAISEDFTRIWDGTDIYLPIRGSNIPYGFDKTYIQDWDYLTKNGENFEINFNCQ